MTSLLVAFIASLLCTFFIIRYEHLHHRFSGDNDLSGPQKVHIQSVPRIGGLSIAAGLAAATLLSFVIQEPKTETLLIMLISAIPVFGIGFAEDVTKTIGIKTRLAFTALSALAVSHFLNSFITSISIVGIDWLLLIPVISILFTCFAITGLANAYNIIDGFNGLAGMVALISLVGIAYVGILVKDPVIASLAFVMIGAIAGFFIWNYPRGLIFLGDGGSYLIGFWIATLSILLVSRHQEISPWFALMVNGYPIFETLFTIYRRKIHRGKNPGMPDAIHFHTLLFRRVLRPAYLGGPDSLGYIANSRTSPYLWILSGCAVIPAILFWESTPILMICAAFFGVAYIAMYRAIVCFKTPKWFHIF
jgi:UDP-N-acetylmuramyl pentapeptide phosphotransferase/UDP-N-acetylglucosamine-1-phosphate transferase